MKKLTFIFLITFLGSLTLASCSRIQEPTKGELKVAELKKLDAIPLEYGSLVSVTANPEFSRWAQLWFEDDDRTIRIVSVGYFDQKILGNVTVIPRN